MNQEALLPNVLTISGGVIAIALIFGALSFILGRVIMAVGRRSSSELFLRSREAVRKKVRRLLVLATVIACLGGLAYGVVLMFEGKVLHEFLIAQMRTVPSDFWVNLAIEFGKVVAVVIATFYVLRLAKSPLTGLANWTRRQEALEPSREVVDRAVESIGLLVRNAAWLAVVYLSTVLIGLPAPARVAARVVLMVYLIVAIGLLLRRLLQLGVDSLDRLARNRAKPDNWLRFYDRLSHLLPLLRSAVDYVLLVTMASLVVLQVEAIAPLAQWGRTFITIIGILFLSRVVVEVVRLFLHETMVVGAASDPEKQKRRATITPLIANIAAGLIYFGAGVACLGEIGIDPMPILAGAGLLGLAVGLGAQTLVNDILSGFFLLFEGYFLVGDYVEAGGVSGYVDKLDLRTTRIRDTDGRLHLVPNGEIRRVTNCSKDALNAVVDVGVDYASDLETVEQAVQAACAALREKSPDVLGDTEVHGIQSFGGSEIVVRTVTKVRPGRHLHIQRALRVELKRAFDAAGIEIPFAHRVLVFKDPSERPRAGTRHGEPGESPASESKMAKQQ